MARCAHLPSSSGLAGTAKDRSRCIRPVMHFYPGKPIHFYSGVGIRAAADMIDARCAFKNRVLRNRPGVSQEAPAVKPVLGPPDPDALRSHRKGKAVPST